MYDVFAFVGILLVFLVSYGVAVQTLLFPFEEPSWHLLVNVLYEPFFLIYGRLFLDLYRKLRIQADYDKKHHFLLV